MSFEKDPTSSAACNTRKQAAPAKHWAFTLFDYDEYDINVIVSSKDILYYVFQEETCPTSGKMHLQGYIEFKNKCRFRKSDGQINGCEFPTKSPHWEKSRNVNACINYCQKSDTCTGRKFTNMKIKKPLKLITDLYPWQWDIEQMILTEPDDRTIYWYWDSKGCKGKTALIKYLVTKYNYVTYSTAVKSADIVTLADENKSVYLLNFSRSCPDFDPYNALEQLKDGLISDSKLKKETRLIVMNPPHVICFANKPPNIKKMSKDRWCIICLDEEQEIKDIGFDDESD